jgi:PAS domain S-box-containing protein
MEIARDMRADALRFRDVFRIDPTSGRIRLGTDRYIMLGADSIGSMRRELIDNLGWDVARGIMERVGYQCGRSDARQMREKCSWPSEEEWLRAGPRLHYLEGVVNVLIHSLDIRRAESKFNMSGEWIGSYEAEQHLRSYGTAPAPVCWTLEGYATGYSTEFFGRRVVCIETACRGRGDATCRFELRTAEDWGGAARPVEEVLAAVRFTERFDRCLRSITEMGCELEQTSLDGVVTTDARGIITSCSNGACDLLGLLPGEPIGRPVSTFYSARASEAHRIMGVVKRDGRLHNYITDIITPSGRRIPIALSVSAIRNAAGSIVGTIGVVHNLTEVRRLEDELNTKNRFMANILQDSADAIVTLDPEDVITSWNRGAESIFGYAAGEVIGKAITFLVPPDLRESDELDRLRERVHTQGAVRSYQTERLTKDGRRIQVIFTRTAIRDDSGRMIGVSAVLKDVTFYRNLERELSSAEHLATLGELSAGLAHEIKNPLAGIKGAIDVIREAMPPENEHREILGDVLHEVNRIDRIVRDLLNYAKPRAPSHTDIHLSEITQRIAAIVRQSSNNEAISIQVLTVGEVPDFTGDETQLEQVLLNLLLNAQIAVRKGGWIQVRLSYDGDESAVRIEVQDNGPGIPEEIRKKIFQPFFTTRTEGIGLGLATCLKNVQYHGGSIDVRSEMGAGTTFTVTLPLFCRFRGSR